MVLLLSVLLREGTALGRGLCARFPWVGPKAQNSAGAIDEDEKPESRLCPLTVLHAGPCRLTDTLCMWLRPHRKTHAHPTGGSLWKEEDSLEEGP